ncbi:MAG: NTP transferase domain-containing protein [Proteobacteria bacterium]|nr:NTP transferase domain-containing protein [Pseudomonadota bacterium]
MIERLAVIPARLGGQRLPGKPLLELAGAPLIWHVARRVAAAGVADRVIVATDDARIGAAAAGSGAEVVVDASPFACGTDRVAAVARRWAARWVINVQGDEALVSAAHLLGALAAAERGALGTVATTCTPPGWLEDPHAVKVALGADGRALDFGRSAPRCADARLLLHLGVYAFAGPTLQRLAALSPSARERGERLEQLRALEAGWAIAVTAVDVPAGAINTPADLPAVERALREREPSPAPLPGMRAAMGGSARAVSGLSQEAPAWPISRQK